MNELILNFNNEGEFNYSVHIAPDLGFIYFNNPKCACTTIKATLNVAYGRTVGVPVSYTKLGEIHTRSKNLLLTPLQVGYRRFTDMLRDPGVYKFSFIREPLHRVVSAYASKLAFASEIFVKLANDGVISREHLTFRQFVDLLRTSNTMRDRDEHWRLQCKQICFGSVNFNYIGLFEHLEADLSKVLRDAFHSDEHEVFDVRKSFAGNTSDSLRRLAEVSEEERGMLEDIYRADFLMYNLVAAERHAP